MRSDMATICELNRQGRPPSREADVRTAELTRATPRTHEPASDPRTRVHRLGLLRLRPDPVHGSPSQGPLAARRVVAQAAS